MSLEESSESNFKVDGAILRHCFDPYCSEWNQSSIEEKISTISKNIEENNTNCFALAMKTFVSLKEEYGKDIHPIHILSAMGSILDYLIKERNVNLKG